MNSLLFTVVGTSWVWIGPGLKVLMCMLLETYQLRETRQTRLNTDNSAAVGLTELPLTAYDCATIWVSIFFCVIIRSIDSA